MLFVCKVFFNIVHFMQESPNNINIVLSLMTLNVRLINTKTYDRKNQINIIVALVFKVVTQNDSFKFKKVS